MGRVLLPTMVGGVAGVALFVIWTVADARLLLALSARPFHLPPQPMNWYYTLASQSPVPWWHDVVVLVLLLAAVAVVAAVWKRARPVLSTFDGLFLGVAVFGTVVMNLLPHNIRTDVYRWLTGVPGSAIGHAMPEASPSGLTVGAGCIALALWLLGRWSADGYVRSGPGMRAWMSWFAACALMLAVVLADRASDLPDSYIDLLFAAAQAPVGGFLLRLGGRSLRDAHGESDASPQVRPTAGAEEKI